MPRHTIQVFEHERLVVGTPCRSEQPGEILFTSVHFEALARYVERHRKPPFKLGHRSVTFSQFVGVLQVGALTIEVLPKTDRHAQGDSPLWRDVLHQMIALAPPPPLRRFPKAALSQNAQDLLTLYIIRFLDEVERLLREGLLRGYRTIDTHRGELYPSDHYPVVATLAWPRTR